MAKFYDRLGTNLTTLLVYPDGVGKKCEFLVFKKLQFHKFVTIFCK
nr:MAG TPA: hypothetical protein [Caudoviricetes sp.]